MPDVPFTLRAQVENQLHKGCCEGRLLGSLECVVIKLTKRAIKVSHKSSSQTDNVACYPCCRAEPVGLGLGL